MGLYDPLTRHLEHCRFSRAPFEFSQIEDILRRKLPASARLHPAWWANTSTHSHAEAWMKAGWKTSEVDLARERVVFKKVQDSATDLAGASDEAFTVRLANLRPSARALLERRAQEHGCPFPVAIDSLLGEMALERRRRIRERFPLGGERSDVDSADLIREDRDAR
ncbi:MAG: hypothetical protein JO127_05405 [Caulobacteraceae bacterium]|nr:hypothetical protein [Caulobacteraceae bacterium]